MTAAMDMADIDRITIGLDVQADYRTAPNGMILPIFRPVS